jgi:hypothetical protein
MICARMETSSAETGSVVHAQKMGSLPSGVKSSAEPTQRLLDEPYYDT